MFISHGSGAGNLRSGCQHGQALASTPFWVADCLLTGFFALIWQKVLDLFYKSINPVPKGSILMTHHLSKAPPLNTITLGIRISAYEFYWYTFTLRSKDFHLTMSFLFLFFLNTYNQCFHCTNVLWSVGGNLFQLSFLVVPPSAYHLGY